MTQSNVQVLEKQAPIAPFWSRMPEFFRFPLHFGPMVWVLGTAIATGVLIFVPFGGKLQILVLFAFLRYAFTALELSARGRLHPDSADLSSSTEGDRRPWKMLGLLLFYMVLVFALVGGVSYHQYRKALEKAVAEQKANPKPAPAPSVQLPPQAATDDENDEDDGEQQSTGAPSTSPSSVDMAADDADAGPPLPEFEFPWWTLVVAVLMAIPLPAGMIVIALEDSLLRALNPFITLHFISAMGRAYFVLWLFFGIILVSRAGLEQALQQSLPLLVALPVTTAVFCYLTLTMFCMLGYAAYQYHQELGLSVDVDFEEFRAKTDPKTPQDPLSKQLAPLIAAGDFKEAIAVVKDHMRYDRNDPDLNERLHKLYLLQGDHQATIQHGRTYLGALLKVQRPNEAIALYQKLLNLDPAFVIEDADQVLPLARAAFSSRDAKLASALIRGFDKRFPQHADVAGVYFLGAQILSEIQRNDTQAMAVLRTILKRYPQHAIAQEAKTYLNMLEKLHGIVTADS